jgi:hypothetical protein
LKYAKTAVLIGAFWRFLGAQSDGRATYSGVLDLFVRRHNAANTWPWFDRQLPVGPISAEGASDYFAIQSTNVLSLDVLTRETSCLRRSSVMVGRNI